MSDIKEPDAPSDASTSGEFEQEMERHNGDEDNVLAGPGGREFNEILREPGLSQIQQQIWAMSSTSGPRAMGPDALIDKMPEEQALEALKEVLKVPHRQIEQEHQSRESERNFTERREKRTLFFVGGLCALTVVVALVVLLAGHTAIATHLFTALASLIAGAWGGMGFARRQ